MSSSSSSSSSPGGPAVRRAAAAALAAGALLGVSALPAAAALDAEVSDASNVVVRPVGRAALDVPDTPTTRTDSTGALVGEVVVDTAFTAGVLAVAAHESRYQARVLAGIAARDAAAAADPRARRLAEKLGGLGITPAVHPEGGWRQQAVDVSDHLNALQASGRIDPVLEAAGVALAAAGYGPTPADLLPTTSPAPPDPTVPAVPAGEDPRGPVSGLGDAAAQMTGAVESAAQAVTAATTPPAPAPPARAAATPANAALDPAPQKTSVPSAPVDTEPPPEPPPGPDPADPDTGTGTGTDGESGAGASAGTSSDIAPRSAGSSDDDASTGASSISDVSTGDVSTGDVSIGAASAQDRAAARAAISLLTDLLAALDTTGAAEGADGDAAGLRSALGTVLDRDRLVELGADPADLDKLDTAYNDKTNKLDKTATVTRNSDSDSDDSASADGGGSATGSSVVDRGEQTDDTADTSTTTATAIGAAPGDGAAGAADADVAGGGWERAAVRLAAQAEQAAATDPLAAELAATLADLDLDPSTTTSAETRADDDTDEVVTRGESGNDYPEPEPEPEVPSGDATTDDTGGSAGGAVEASTWDRLADCEASGDWSANTGNGYQGGLQFSPSTWKAHGGQGAAHEASREQQIVVAEKVLAAQGWAAWPACSKRLGLSG